MGKKIILWLVMLMFIGALPCFAQNYFTQADQYLRKSRPVYLIDTPTANFLDSREAQLKLRVYPQGGMLVGLTVGLQPHLMFGVTYGGQNIIGQGKVQWNEAPGVNIRYRIRFERVNFPAVCIGFDSQGYGPYFPDLKRYQIKSKGFYVVMSQNFTILGGFGLHGGLNYSGENSGSEKDLNFFCGAHLILDQQISLMWDYDFGVNDNDSNSLGSGKGYMNAAVRWFFSERLLLEFAVKNLTRNNRTIEGETIPHSSRELKILYFHDL